MNLTGKATGCQAFDPGLTYTTLPVFQPVLRLLWAPPKRDRKRGE
jgi:hypothetical protein